MTDPMTPADLFRHGLRLPLAKDIDGWVALSDERVLVEFPYAPPGYPRRLTGRSELAAYLRDYPAHIDLRDVAHLEIHETADPTTIVAEWRGTGRVVATGAPYDMTYVVVATAHHGRFTRYRDYWNPLAIPDSMAAEQTTARSAP
ncbi:nuclear transport factor 2 family protein [Streptomyces sp. AC536]|uniref:nuclear transport factor 2 family protein n=1 Tax=Streptomyces buecherae TaxID=2763006 RepID=UPI00164DD69B|nr:nuclear transport factor 2 family protein [Streptomyces buecherae]MBC3984448.1 nuclear transport factor 2 family protein [Streptomyces buecherae]QNJ42648.1 nuclear transport factor 2 family protein [Streptomyces buecherae]